MDAERSPGPGFHGKVPTHGDFVTRRLPRSFLGPWDEWLGNAMACSQEQLCDAWHEIYMSSPIWRFALSAGACGEQAAAGVLMPSVDRVGRSYPLALATFVSEPATPLDVLTQGEAWFGDAEETALSSLDDGFDLEAFDGRVASLGAPVASHPATEPVPGLADGCGPGPNGWHIDIGSLDTLPSLGAGMLDSLLRDGFARYSLWWTHGSDRVEPSLLACRGLPAIGGFSALLGGGWSERGWQGEPPVEQGAAACIEGGAQ